MSEYELATFKFRTLALGPALVLLDGEAMDAAGSSIASGQDAAIVSVTSLPDSVPKSATVLLFAFGMGVIGVMAQRGRRREG